MKFLDAVVVTPSWRATLLAMAFSAVAAFPLGWLMGLPYAQAFAPCFLGAILSEAGVSAYKSPKAFFLLLGVFFVAFVMAG